MDPVSLAVNIITLIDTVQKVIKFLNEIKDAPSERDKFLLEAQSSCIFLLQLRDRLTAKDTTIDKPWFRHFASLVAKEGILDQYQSSLEEAAARLEKIVNKRQSRSFRLTLAWKTEKSDIEGIFQRIERCKSTIAIALSNDTFTVSISSSETIRSVKDNQDRSTKDQHKRTVFDWVEKAATRYDVLQHDYINQAQDGTGEWFLNAQTFQKWVQGAASTLYCPGIPGAGKTIMTSIAMDYLKSHFPRADHNVAVVYFNYNRKSEQNHVQLLFSIMWQFVRQRTEIPPSLDEFHEKHERSGPKVKDLINLMATLIQESTVSFLLLDALDEFLDEDNGRSKFLHHISELRNTGKLHIMMTFRPNTEISSVSKGDSFLTIHATEEDLKSYIRQRVFQMDSLPDCIAEDEDSDVLQEKVIDKITQASDGMFLLAKLHSDSLQDAFTIDEIEETLESLSSGETAITDAYNSAIDRIDMQRPKRKQLAHQVIAWIVYSHRPLSPMELQNALAIKPGHFQDPKRNLPGIKIVLAVCAGLVVVDEETRVIRLVHYTTQEYFSKGKLRGWLPGIELEVARSCITYLLIPDLYESVLQYHEQWSREQYRGRPVSYSYPQIYDNPYYIIPSGRTFESWEVWSDVQKWPFFVYAIKYWGNHCQPFQEALEAMIVAFFSSPRTLALYWTHHTEWDIERTYRLAKFELEKPGPISIASRLGLDIYLERLLVQGHTYEPSAWLSANEQDFWRRRRDFPIDHLVEQHPLVLASHGGYYRAAKILLKHTYTAEKDLYRALRTACSKRNPEIVELLISRWPSKEIDLMEIAEFDIIDSGKPRELLLSRNLQNSFRSLRILAGRRGASSWIPFLLQRDWDTDVDEMGNGRRVVLEKAASEGCLENLQLLLAHPKFDLSLEMFDFDGPRNLFGYTIVEAAHSGQHETVDFLLKNRPQLKPRTMKAILIKAFKCARASVNMTKSFDERFREVRYDELSRDNLCRCLNLLRQVSSWPGKNIGIQHHRGLVADVNEKIHRMLHNNARMDPKKWYWDDQTPLSYAAAAEDNNVAVKLLLQHPGVDADSRDSCGSTPLSRAATVKENSATVRLLLDHPGVNPDSFDSFHLTPLSWAIFGGCVESVRALLGRTRISRKEYKRAAAVRLAQLWLGWKRELGSTKRLNVNSATQDERDHVVLSTARDSNYHAVVILLMSEIEQLYLKEYSAAVSNGALILALLEESNESTSRGKMSG